MNLGDLNRLAYKIARLRKALALAHRLYQELKN
jgi:hypothetical protein